MATTDRSAALSAFHDYMKARMGTPVLLDAVNAFFTFAVFSLLFALIYRVLPDVEIPWRDVWLGSLVTAGLFSLGKWLIGLYLGVAAVAFLWRPRTFSFPAPSWGLVAAISCTMTGLYFAVAWMTTGHT